MDMGIVNAGKLPLYDDIEPEIRQLLTEVIFNKSDDGKHVERLITYAKEEKERLDNKKDGGVKKEKKVLEWRNHPVEERLKTAVIKGY